MANNRKQQSGMPAWAKTLIVFILVAAILGGAGYAVYHFFGDDIKNFFHPENTPQATLTVTVGGKTYDKDADGFTFVNGTEIGVTGAGKDGFNVTVSKAGKTDFAFTVGENARKWATFEITDYTSAFSQKLTENGFILMIPPLTEIIQKATGTTQKVTISEMPQGDIFIMTIAAKDKSGSINLGFGLSELYIEVTPSNIVM